MGAPVGVLDPVGADDPVGDPVGAFEANTVGADDPVGAGVPVGAGDPVGEKEGCKLGVKTMSPVTLIESSSKPGHPLGAVVMKIKKLPSEMYRRITFSTCPTTQS